jgi:hypothetical protein
VTLEPQPRRFAGGGAADPQHDVGPVGVGEGGHLQEVVGGTQHRRGGDVGAPPQSRERIGEDRPTGRRRQARDRRGVGFGKIGGPCEHHPPLVPGHELGQRRDRSGSRRRLRVDGADLGPRGRDRRVARLERLAQGHVEVDRAGQRPGRLGDRPGREPTQLGDRGVAGDRRLREPAHVAAVEVHLVDGLTRAPLP